MDDSEEVGGYPQTPGRSRNTARVAKPMPKPDLWHVIPLDDLRFHLESVTCWCRPTVDEADNICVHHALDRRETREQGQVLH